MHILVIAEFKASLNLLIIYTSQHNKALAKIKLPQTGSIKFSLTITPIGYTNLRESV